ncbi:cell division protein FtsX [Peptoniphilus asaccharolyticus DSM 20463]|uniref:Cell division protein FtsX n=1 Tax=Peptoniphilus asaccharolyticus DSM 20463 TaxID=573058 RepID=A0A1W1UC90_PEPAS|nr:cell division protein FtsX [Peptoniphilus asaccharolyticus DSM 20463]
MEKLKYILFTTLFIIIFKILFIHYFGISIDEIYAKYVTSSFIGRYHIDIIGLVVVALLLIICKKNER